jgi:broad specificity phosphatase PhoE
MPSLPIQPSRIGRWTQFVIVGIVVVVVIGWWYFCWKPQHTSILLVRHADKVANQDALTPAGEMRAAKLVHVAGKAGITAIYHSDTNRTRRTAEDLANHLGITPIEIPAANAQQLINAIRSNHQGETVFIVGHSNTVPQIIAGLGGSQMPVLPHAEFDNFFVITLCPCSSHKTTVVNLQYGEPTPP